MAIKHAKITATRPPAFKVWLSDVHDDGHPILVIVLHKSVKGIYCISFDCSIAALDKFNR
jgi:hypothetical protein